MTYPQNKRYDIRDHSRALIERNAIDRMFVGRADIFNGGALLVQVLGIKNDASRRKAASKALLSLGMQPVSPEKLAKSLVKSTEFDRDDCTPGLPVPAGVRHPLYCFSPSLLLAAELAPDRRVSGIPIGELPLTAPKLVEYLYRSIDLPLPYSEIGSEDDEWEMEPEDASFELDRAFARKFGFSIEAVADQLVRILAADPQLYLLILSREIELIEPRLKQFDLIGGLKGWPGEVQLIQALKAIYELQRAAVIAWTLRQWNGVSITTMQTVISGVEDEQIGRQMHAELQGSSGAGNVLDVAPVHAEALLRYLRSQKQWSLVKDVRGILGSLKSALLTWNHLCYSLSVEGGHVLPTAVRDNFEPFKRTQGNGKGYHGSRLDLFCGLDAELIYPMAMLEIGATLKRNIAQKDFDQLIAANAQCSGIKMSIDGAKPEHLRKKAARFRSGYLPEQGSWGSAGRFDPDQWGQRFSDRPLWRSFTKSIREILDNRKASKGKLRLLDVAVLLMARRFKLLFAQMNAVPVVIEIVCDLATSVCQLTTDPILAKQLVREECERNRKRHLRRAARRRPSRLSLPSI